MAAASSPTSGYRAQMVETLEDSVSGELMTQAVTLIPCGHVFNEDTVIQVLATSGLCPNDRTPIRRHIPNYTIRDLAQTTSAHPEERAQPREEEPTEEASTHFNIAKAMSEQDNYEGAIVSLLQALQISPHFQKAQAYLDFCLSRAAEKESASSPLQSSPKSQGGKDKYTTLLLDLLEHPQIKADSILEEILGTAVGNLIESRTSQLTAEEEIQYKWAEQLLGEDRKVRSFVVKKLHVIHGGEARPQTTALAPPLHQNYGSASAAVSARIVAPVLSSIPAMAFGRVKWEQYFGLQVIEPPLPSDIEKILAGPCPIFPGKKVAETHLLTLIPKNMTLEQLESLTQNPKQGHKIGFYIKDDRTWRQHHDTSSGEAHWVLMTNDIIPDSRGKSWKDQQILAAQFKGQRYGLLSGIDVATCLLLEYVETRYRFYETSLHTFTRCTEKVSGRHNSESPMVIGGFAPGGVRLSCQGDDDGGVSTFYGVGIARHFY